MGETKHLVLQRSEHTLALLLGEEGKVDDGGKDVAEAVRPRRGEVADGEVMYAGRNEELVPVEDEP